MVYQNGKAVAMSLALGNEVSQPSQDIYSTEETVIGTWIDGKPLYRKVFSGTLAGEVTRIPVDTQGFEYKFLNGSLVSDSAVIPLNYNSTEQYWCRSYIDLLSSNSVVIAVASAYSTKDYVIELLYTKAEGFSSVLPAMNSVAIEANGSDAKIM